MTDLKPCPFCGGHAVQAVDDQRTISNDVDRNCHVVQCLSCGARTASLYGAEPSIRFWNMRAGGE